ncbi:hypothetical protein [Cohnella soli]|uniref:Non-reducing end beta-L-arabinofuranosidase-like GH127 middle domain-containing protein n=1 Tax=Cohnella soli TaxID=425005 RepID=A0ABW0HXA8_9BACL
MKTAHWKEIKVYGDMYERAILNYDRLETEEYRCPRVFREGGYSWPGDWEGRTILALVMLAQSTGREPLYLAEIMKWLPERLNAKGYFGTIHGEGLADEQQLSGHSWLLRAMAEHHLWKGDDASLRVLEDVVRHLLLPVRGLYNRYPIEAEARVTEKGEFGGEAIGSLLEGRAGEWYLSTDVGCAFILLDGATHAYQLLKWPELAELIEEMIANFRRIDLAGLSFQTHATLSALRGILRHYDTTGDASLLQLAQTVFSLYTREGMTENYANYNWFGRPEWTEPCAVVDSFIVAVELWKHTAEASYLELAQGILYNGLGYGQRPNGGFGCDCCAGAHDEWLQPKTGLFEAYWCCSMRGGDGLSRAIGYGCFTDQERGAFALPFPQNGQMRITLAGGQMTAMQTTAYPYEGTIRLEIRESTIGVPVTAKIFFPSWSDAKKARLKVNGQDAQPVFSAGFVEWTGIPMTGTVVEMSMPVELRWENTLNARSLPDRRSLYHGALMLGSIGGANASETSFELSELEPVSASEAVYRIRGSGLAFRPIRELGRLAMERAAEDRRQVLFR